MVVEGKYCQIAIQPSQLANFGDTFELQNLEKDVDSIKDKINLYEGIRKNLHSLDGIDTRWAKLKYFYFKPSYCNNLK